MSKIGDIFKKVEDGISDFFTGDKKDDAGAAEAACCEEKADAECCEEKADAECCAEKADAECCAEKADAECCAEKADKAGDAPDEGSYTVDTENLAIPEIHTGKVDHTEEQEEPEETITYDTLAMPEIHIKHK